MSKFNEKAEGAFSGLKKAQKINSDESNDTEGVSNKKKPKEDSDKKIKRTYMLTKEQLKALHLLKVEYPDKDLSEIVGEAIEEKLEKHN